MEGFDAFTQNWEGEINWSHGSQDLCTTDQSGSHRIGPRVATRNLVRTTQLTSHKEHSYTLPRQVLHFQSPGDGDTTSSPPIWDLRAFHVMPWGARNPPTTPAPG